jgi:hypothetical protein
MPRTQVSCLKITFGSGFVTDGLIGGPKDLFRSQELWCVSLFITQPSCKVTTVCHMVGYQYFYFCVK